VSPADRLSSLKDSIYDVTEGVKTAPVLGPAVVAAFACVLLWVTKGVLTEHNIMVLGCVTGLYILVHGFNEWRRMELTTKVDIANLGPYTKALEILNKDGAMTESDLASAAKLLRPDASKA
jgi:hypothetical protein